MYPHSSVSWRHRTAEGGPDGQCSEQHRRRPGSTAEYACLVLPCTVWRLLSSWRAVMDRRWLAAVALEVSFWACSRTLRKQMSSTTPLPESESPTWARSWHPSWRRPALAGHQRVGTALGCRSLPHWQGRVMTTTQRNPGQGTGGGAPCPCGAWAAQTARVHVCPCQSLAKHKQGTQNRSSPLRKGLFVTGPNGMHALCLFYNRHGTIGMNPQPYSCF